jgi:predicted RND superfamily exporter protein
MCSFTTVVGYGSLVFSDFQALEGFGKLAVVGELGCVFGAVFFVPAVLSVLRRRS